MENYIEDCIKDSGDDFVTIEVSDWQGEVDLKITISNVIEFYVNQANNIFSGCRTLAGHSGDWRPISALADFALEYFKEVNVEGLRKESLKRGLEPKF